MIGYCDGKPVKRIKRVATYAGFRTRIVARVVRELRGARAAYAAPCFLNHACSRFQPSSAGSLR